MTYEQYQLDDSSLTKTNLQQKILSNTISAGLTLISFLVIIIENQFYGRPEELSFLSILSICSALISLLLLEYDFLAKSYNSILMKFISFPGILEILSLCLSLAWFLASFGTLLLSSSISNISYHPLPNILPCLSLVSFLLWGSYPFVGMLPITRNFY